MPVFAFSEACVNLLDWPREICEFPFAETRFLQGSIANSITSSNPGVAIDCQPVLSVLAPRSHASCARYNCCVCTRGLHAH